jgi:thioredoxin reductase
MMSSQSAKDSAMELRSLMQDKTDVSIIGAGPYGLSLAAHLAKQRDMRIYGPPMAIWRTAMPSGMRLKSEGFASNLSDPAGKFPLQRYCAEHHLPYRDVGLPVTIENFIAYGLEFQRRFVQQIDQRKVVSLEETGDSFELRLDDGHEVLSNRVVIATGISNFEYIPEELRGLPPSLLSHSSAQSDVSQFGGGAAGKEIVVIGGGASAIDIAALLDECGASVTIVSRHPIKWCGPPVTRSMFDRIIEPQTGLGPGWKSLLCVKAPLLFHAMPEAFRLYWVRKHLGPFPGWVPCARVQKNVKIVMVTSIKGARAAGNRAVLSVSSDGRTSDLMADHVIAATGYRPDLRRLHFIGQNILSRLRTVENAPVLNRQFRSSIPGLYFIGLSAANSFGPMMRFAYGADYVARRLAPELCRERVARNIALRGGAPLPTRT